MDLILQERIWQSLLGIVLLLAVLIAITIISMVQSARRNHLLKSIDRSLKTLPAVQHQRNLDLVQKRAV